VLLNGQLIIVRRYALVGFQHWFPAQGSDDNMALSRYTSTPASSNHRLTAASQKVNFATANRSNQAHMPTIFQQHATTPIQHTSNCSNYRPTAASQITGREFPTIFQQHATNPIQHTSNHYPCEFQPSSNHFPTILQQLHPTHFQSQTPVSSNHLPTAREFPAIFQLYRSNVFPTSSTSATSSHLTI
jgi:hypothetical protein